jgi:hypothetical protein
LPSTGPYVVTPHLQAMVDAGDREISLIRNASAVREALHVYAIENLWVKGESFRYFVLTAVLEYENGQSGTIFCHAEVLCYI